MEYFIKGSAILAIFYLFYKLILQKETFFQSNRIFLLIGLFAALTIPYIIIPVHIDQPQLAINDFIINDSKQINKVLPSIDWISIATIAYFGGVLFFGIKFLLSIISLINLIIRSPKKKINGLYYLKSNVNISPFSFFNYIVYNPKQFKQHELQQILTHEKVHAYQWHSFDVLISQLITIIYWFNPFSWFYKKELQQNLEFIADSISQKKTTCKESYQKLLLKSSISINQLNLTNNFYNSLIKKRIIMLHKNRSKNTNQWKFSLIIPLMSAFIFTFNTKVISQNNTQNKNHTIHTDTEMVIITKDTSDNELEQVKNDFSNEGITVKFKGIKRNNNQEITTIKIDVNSKESSANYNTASNNPINPIKISFDNEGGNISVGSSNMNHENNFVFVSKDGKHSLMSKGKEEQNLIFISDDKMLDEHEVLEIKDIGDNVFAIKKDGVKKIIHIDHDSDKKVWITKDKNIEVIDVKESKGGSKVLIHSNNNDPIYYIDGKKASKDDIEKLDPNSIEKMEVYKGDKAIEKYGEIAKYGIIDITTKKN